MNDVEKAIHEAFLEGLRSEPTSHEEFRAARRATPDDVQARARHFGALTKQHLTNRDSEETLQEGLWWIEHHPTLQFTGTVCHQFMHAPFPQYSKVRTAWDVVLARLPDSPAALQNAGNAFQRQEPERSEQLWQEAHRLAPTDHMPAWHLAMLRFHRARRPLADAPENIDGAGAKDSLTWLEIALGRATTDEHREFILPWACDAAIATGEFDRAEAFGQELLRIASMSEPSKKTGTAIFAGHITLGRVALAHEDIENARQHLLEAGKTPGSGSLDSFGPDFTLADALLRRGERAAVLTFLEGCSTFWKMDRGKLLSWRLQIQQGGTPVLSRFG